MAITYDYKVRKTVVESVLSGKSHDEARRSAGVDVCERSIYRWLEWHREHGDEGLEDKRHGVVWKMTDELRSWLIEEIEENPKQSARQLQKQVQKVFGIKVSISHINQTRANAGLSRRAMPPKSQA